MTLLVGALFVAVAVRAKSLLIAMNTVVRPNVDYLSDTVHRMVEQTRAYKPNGTDSAIEQFFIYVRAVDKLNSGTGDVVPNVAFDRLQDEYRDDSRVHFRHVRADEQVHDMGLSNNKVQNYYIEQRKRQKTLDTIGLLHDALLFDVDYVLLAEDDLHMCDDAALYLDRALVQIERLTHKRCASHHCWAYFRVGLYNQGLVFPRDRLWSLVRYLNHYYLGRPNDFLIVDWAHSNWPLSLRQQKHWLKFQPTLNAEYNDVVLPKPLLPHISASWTKDGGPELPRFPQFIARTLLFEHRGRVSTLTNATRRFKSRCGTRIEAFDHEKFRSQCRDFLVSPCKMD